MRFRLRFWIGRWSIIRRRILRLSNFLICFDWVVDWRAWNGYSSTCSVDMGVAVVMVVGMAFWGLASAAVAMDAGSRMFIAAALFGTPAYLLMVFPFALIGMFVSWGYCDGFCRRTGVRRGPNISL